VHITRIDFKTDGIILPLIKISPETRIGNAVIIHGFGGCKEEQLGLGFRLAEFGLDTYAVDLRGHGQNVKPFSLDVFDDINILVRSLKGEQQTITIGHSLGGRLSLLSQANFRIGISPALSQTFSDQTISIINTMRKHRVIEAEKDSNFKILSSLPVVDDLMGPDDLILYGERDIPEIAQSCRALAETHKNVLQLPGAMHGDTFLLEASFDHLKKWLLSPGRLTHA